MALFVSSFYFILFFFVGNQKSKMGWDGKQKIYALCEINVIVIIRRMKLEKKEKNLTPNKNCQMITLCVAGSIEHEFMFVYV